MCNFPGFNSAPPGSTGQKGCETSQKKRCSWLEGTLCTYLKRVFGRFFTNVGKHLTQAVGRRSICSILLSTYLQIMLLSLGIITNPMDVTETQMKTLGNIKTAASGNQNSSWLLSCKKFLQQGQFYKRKPQHFSVERKCFILQPFFYISACLGDAVGEHFICGIIGVI